MLVNIIVAIAIGVLGVMFDVSGGVFATMLLVGVFVIGPFINHVIRGDY